MYMYMMYTCKLHVLVQYIIIHGHVHVHTIFCTCTCTITCSMHVQCRGTFRHLRSLMVHFPILLYMYMYMYSIYINWLHYYWTGDYGELSGRFKVLLNQDVPFLISISTRNRKVKTKKRLQYTCSVCYN